MKSGQVDATKVKQEERRLGRMEKRLGGLQSDLEQTASTATGLFGFLGFGGGSGTGGSASGSSDVAPSKKPSSNRAGESVRKGASPRGLRHGSWVMLMAIAVVRMLVLKQENMPRIRPLPPPCHRLPASDPSDGSRRPEREQCGNAFHVATDCGQDVSGGDDVPEPGVCCGDSVADGQEAQEAGACSVK